MSAREQAADLQPGDVVELRWHCYTDVAVSGPLYPRGGGQWVGPVPVIKPSGELYPELDVTVVSRAPRPLYVNHPRTEPVPGDFARDEDADGIRLILRMSAVGRRDEEWFDQDGTERTFENTPGRRLRLLVDGETGQVVP